MGLFGSGLSAQRRIGFGGPLDGYDETIGSRALGVSPGDFNVLGASLKDALAYFGGRPEQANNLSPAMQQNAAMNAMAAQRQMFADIMGPDGKIDTQKAARAAAAGIDIAPLVSLSRLQNPQDAANPTVHEGVNPATGKPGQYTIGRDRIPNWLPVDVAPKQNNFNQPFNADGTPNLAYQAYQKGLRKAGEGVGEKAPAGYRWGAGGNLEFIPGGPADPTKGAGKKAPTEDQAKNNQLYQRASAQLKILMGDGKSPGTFDALASGLNQAGAAVSNGIGIPLTDTRLGLPKGWTTSGEYQRASNALTDIASSYLYSVSGATATPGEIAKITETITPRFNEDAQSVADKKARLQQMVDSIRERATPSAPPQPGNLPSQNGAKPVTKTLNGKTYQQINGQWYEAGQ